ncbi:MAG: ATP-binding protein [Gemmatimonadetes bacterium]|nr:ATP-binding protein [Gemmatimonadota bacterium]
MNNNTLAIAEQNLSAVSCDNVLHNLKAFWAQRDEDNIVLDLSQLGFVDPYGMGMLCLIGRHLSTRYWDITCHLPENSDVERYLTRMKVFDALKSYVTVARLPQTGQSRRNESLLEITTIEQRSDIEQVLSVIESRVGAILSEELHYTVREITGFKNVVAELCHNILDHSGDKGFVVAQRYTNHRLNRKFAIIGVCDLGIGIRESLSAGHDTAHWSHGQAIKMAIQKTVSRGNTRGLGLYIVKQICQENNGRLHIRSGDERVYIREDEMWVYPSTLFPGTQVSIALYEKQADR